MTRLDSVLQRVIEKVLQCVAQRALVRLNQGQVEAYAKARKVAWDWILQYPMRNNHWSGYFEDVNKDTENVNQACPTMAAYYVLSSPNPNAVDSHWTGDVGHLIDWVRQKFGRGPYFGAWAIDEQGGSSRRAPNGWVLTLRSR